MNAEPLLNRIAEALWKVRLEAIMVGNAAAALKGAPVTTLDIDFMFRKTPVNLRKLKTLADELNAYILKPYYPLSGLYRVVNDETGMQLDFMSTLHGVKSFASLRADADEVAFGKYKIKIASLRAVIKSKKAAGRERDKAVLKILEETLREKEILKEKSTEGSKKGK